MLLVANADDVVEVSARPEQLEDRGLRCSCRQREAEVGERFDGEGVHLARLETGTHDLEARSAELPQESFCHTAARSVVHTDEEHAQVSAHGAPPGATASMVPVSSHAAASVFVIVPNLRTFLWSSSTRAGGSSVTTRR